MPDSTPISGVRGTKKFSPVRSHYQALAFIGLLLAPAADAEIVINELMFSPPSEGIVALENPDLEFVELANTGATGVNLAGWSFADGIDFTFPSVTLAPGGYLVVASSKTKLLATSPGLAASKVVGDFSGSLSNGGEKLELVDSEGQTIDKIEYADDGEWGQRVRGPLIRNHRGWEWASEHDGGGMSLELTSPLLDNSIGGAWAIGTVIEGTPGVDNSTLASDVAPLLTELENRPRVPKSDDWVRIKVQIAPGTGSGIFPVLHYRLDGNTHFQTKNMTDDGNGADSESGDGEYTATIPPFPDGSVVEYFVFVCDSSGIARRYPKLPQSDIPGEQANHLYQVNDTFDPAAPADPLKPHFLIVMTEAERAELEQIHTVTFDSVSDAQMNATIVTWTGGDLKDRHNCGVRNRGNTSRDDQPNNFHINFRNDRTWNGVSEVNINSRAAYSRMIGSAVFQRAGIEISRVVPALVRVNGGDLSTPRAPYYSFYAQEESYGGDWADNHFPNDPDGNFYRANRQGLTLATTIQQLQFRYSKKTNRGENNWTDLLQMIGVLHNSPDVGYLDAISPHVDVEQWLRFLAISSLINNRETNISNGRRDDFALYRGAIDQRFKLVPHDMDSVMGNDTTVLPILAAAGNPGLTRLLAIPEVKTAYFALIRHYASTLFSDEQMSELLHSLLSDHVPQSQIDTLLANNTARRQFLLSNISQTFIAETTLAEVNGLPETTSPATALSGSADAATTSSILVGGVAADYDPEAGLWTIPNAALLPGENNLLIQALGPDGSEVDRQRLQVRYNAGSSNLVTDVNTDLTLTAAGGPWRFAGGTTLVNSGATLIIEPGATVYFDQNALLRVAPGGRIEAKGTDRLRIQFTRLPASGTEGYLGLHIASGAVLENNFSYLDMRYGGLVNDYHFHVDHSLANFDNVSWEETTQNIIRLTSPTVEMRNCVFPTTSSDTITGAGMTGDMKLIIEGCTFAGPTGNTDVINFTGGIRPGPILQVLNNTFLSGSDEVLDLDGSDAHIEGNVFMNIHRDNSTPGTSNVISAGQQGGHASHLTIVRNVFNNIDHALLLKDGATALFENNTVVNADIAAINFADPESGLFNGGGAIVRGNIFADNALSFQNIIPEVDLIADLNTIPVADHVYGSGNIDVIPGFVAPALNDFSLLSSSPCIGAGPNGLDMGAYVPRWSNLTEVSSTLTSRTFQVGGPGLVAYRYELDGGGFGSETEITTPITLAGLSAGTHQISVIGKNSAGVWQDVNAPTLSREFSTDPTSQPLLLNEVLAANTFAFDAGDGSSPDYIEILNTGDSTLILDGYMISDDSEEPDKYVIPAGTSLAGGQRMIFLGGDGSLSGAQSLGFSLNASGEQVLLSNPAGDLIDIVTFGCQVDGYSISRDVAGAWKLGDPTPAETNRTTALAPATQLRINEWLSAPQVLLGGDFVELYNTASLPVSLEGLALTERPFSDPQKQIIPPLSFISSNGFCAFFRDRSGETDGLEFNIDPLYGSVGLNDLDGSTIDFVSHDAQAEDRSHGRLPDGSGNLGQLALPTPGLSNLVPADSPASIDLVESLRVTEIHYNPTAGSDAEFIELRNIGGTVIDLEGVSLDNAISFTFEALLLQPGERVVVVSDLEGFEDIYGSDILVAGEFSGKLSNGGEDILLAMPSPHQIAIQRFEYNDNWYPSTDGDGNSLVIIDPLAPAVDWSDAEAWQPSTFTGGSPAQKIPLVTIQGPGYLSGPGVANFTGLLTDEGYPVSDGFANYSWQMITGPASPIFGDSFASATTIAFPDAGEYTIELTVIGASGNHNTTLTILVNDHFLQWQNRHFTATELAAGTLSGPTADPDSDGLENLIEYAFGTSPRLAGQPMSYRFELDNSGQPTLIFAMPTWITDLSYHLESSNDLINWFPEPNKLLERTPVSSGIDEVRASSIVPPADKGFLRLWVEQVN